LVYSKAEDDIFCLPCVLFANRDNLGQFVSEKFNYWTAKVVNLQVIFLTNITSLQSSTTTLEPGKGHSTYRLYCKAESLQYHQQNRVSVVPLINIYCKPVRQGPSTTNTRIW